MKPVFGTARFAPVILFAGMVAVGGDEKPYSEHPLFHLAADAANHGIRTDVIDDVVALGDRVTIERHDYGSGSQTAGYVPSRRTLRFTDDAFNDEGQVIPSQMPVTARSQLIEDAFHESFHAKWHAEHTASDNAARVIGQNARVQFLREHNIILSEAGGMEVFEEGIAVTFGKIVGNTYEYAEQAMQGAQRCAGRGDTPQQMIDSATRWMQRMADAARGKFNGPASAYHNDYDGKTIQLDLGDWGRTYLETELLGGNIEDFIERAKGRLLDRLRRTYPNVPWPATAPATPPRAEGGHEEGGDAGTTPAGETGASNAKSAGDAKGGRTAADKGDKAAEGLGLPPPAKTPPKKGDGKGAQLGEFR